MRLWYAHEGPTAKNMLLHYLWPIVDKANQDDQLVFISSYFSTLAGATRFMDGLLVGLEDDMLTVNTSTLYSAIFIFLADNIENFPCIREAMINRLTRLIMTQYKIISKELCQEPRFGKMVKIQSGLAVLAYVCGLKF